MNSKVLTILFLSIAVAALSVSVAVRSVKRAEAARALAEHAASREEIAIREAKKAEAEQKTAEAKARAEASAAEKAKADAEARAAEQKTKALEASAAAKAAEEAASDAAAAKDRARERQDQAAIAKAEAKKAADERAKAEAEAAKARYAADAEASRLETEKAKLETAIQRTKELELRKIDFESWQTRLAELDQELDERERALRPETSIYDSSNITWVAEREPDVIGVTGTLRRAKREAILSEDDPLLPYPTRRLAKCEREVAQETAQLGMAASNSVVTALERLYAKACEDGRLIDADYYARSIRLFYPQWVYRPPESVKP